MIDDLPRCPHCGCNDIEKERTTKVFGMVSDVMRCNHCGKHHRREHVPEPTPEVTGVVVARLCCPACGSKRVPTYSSRKDGTRYRKCKDCKHRFKTIEV